MSDWGETAEVEAEPFPEAQSFAEPGFSEDQVEEGGREYGVVKRWTEGKGFGFIQCNNRDDNVFCHIRNCPARAALVPGSKVSFIFEADQKSGKAKEIQIEEAAVEREESPREMGTVKQWKSDKGFGFIGRASGDDLFFHSKDCGGVEFAPGQAVSFVVGEGPKGASAKKVQQEEGGTIKEVIAEDEQESDRQLGKVKSYNEERGFAFIAPCTGGDDLFSHKKEFRGVDPFVGMPVSYILKATERGDSAAKVRQEDSVPEPVLSDEGREFGKVKNFMTEKGFGFINWKGEEAAIVFDKEANGLTLVKDMCVSFKYEEGPKGPMAKDIREESPERVARATAKVHYGTVESYWDPTPQKPTNGYGFIKPFGPAAYGAPKKYYFHMSEIEDPDEDGGIEPHSNVSFIVTAARKGFQAVAVKIAEPPKEAEQKENQDPLQSAVAGMSMNDATSEPAADAPAEDDAWATWGS